MEFDYVVHSVSLVKQAAKVMHEGEEMFADIDTYEVELTPPHDAPHGGGSVMLRFNGKNLAKAQEMFVANKMVKLSCMPVDKWAAGKGPDAKKVDGPHADPDQSEEAQRARHKD